MAGNLPGLRNMHGTVTGIWKPVRNTTAPLHISKSPQQVKNCIESGNQININTSQLGDNLSRFAKSRTATMPAPCTSLLDDGDSFPVAVVLYRLGPAGIANHIEFGTRLQMTLVAN